MARRRLSEQETSILDELANQIRGLDYDQADYLLERGLNGRLDHCTGQPQGQPNSLIDMMRELSQDEGADQDHAPYPDGEQDGKQDRGREMPHDDQHKEVSSDAHVLEDGRPTLTTPDRRARPGRYNRQGEDQPHGQNVGLRQDTFPF